MHKVLVGINDKNCSMRAVTYLMKRWPGVKDLEIRLAHVIPDLPAMYWDDGHILNPTEAAERSRVIETWAARQREYIGPILQGAVYDLERNGFAAERISTSISLGTGDVADSLLDLAAEGGFKTILVGRCGIADGKHLLAGSVISKLIHQAVDLAVVVVH